MGQRQGVEKGGGEVSVWNVRAIYLWCGGVRHEMSAFQNHSSVVYLSMHIMSLWFVYARHVLQVYQTSDTGRAAIRDRLVCPRSQLM